MFPFELRALLRHLLKRLMYVWVVQVIYSTLIPRLIFLMFLICSFYEKQSSKGMLLPWVDNWLKKKQQQIGVNGCRVTGEMCSEVLHGPGVGVTKPWHGGRCYKVIMLVRTRKGSVGTEKVLTAACGWAVKQQMKFSVDKYTVVHTGRYTAPVLFCTWNVLLWNKPLGLL